MEFLAIMWKQLTHNTALAFIAVLLISGSNSFVAYESSKTNVNIEAITRAMENNTAEVVKVSEKAEENSRAIANNQKYMLELQAKILEKDWVQDQVLSDMYKAIAGVRDNLAGK
tara:strand:- start:3620 stop:3961 length:342 start_codon:yes stop_codon:yes gene_type:complete